VVRGVATALGLVVVLAAVVLGVEVWLALRRDYLPTDDLLDLDRIYGPEGAPRLRLVVLGDSTAAGIGVDDPADAYASLLARRLSAELHRRVELTVLGVPGARVRDVARDQAPRANDVTHLTSLGDVRDDFRRALRTLEASGAAIVVAGPPDMRVPVWHQPLRHLSYLRGKQVADAVEGVARGEGVRVVELAEETGPFFAEDPDAHFSSDGFHPGPLGYRRWADAIFPVLLEAVNERV
jgi:lysophospholipase L1-like esterase